MGQGVPVVTAVALIVETVVQMTGKIQLNNYCHLPGWSLSVED